MTTNAAPTLKLIIEMEGRRFEVSVEEAQELARQLLALLPSHSWPQPWYPPWPTWPPMYWTVTTTGTGSQSVQMNPYVNP